MAQSHLLAIHVDIRHMIYEHLLPPSFLGLPIGDKTEKVTSFGPLLRTCKKLKSEAEDWFNIEKYSHLVKIPRLGLLDPDNTIFYLTHGWFHPRDGYCCKSWHDDPERADPVGFKEIDPNCAKLNSPWCAKEAKSILPSIKWLDITIITLDTDTIERLLWLLDVCTNLEQVDLVIFNDAPLEPELEGLLEDAGIEEAIAVITGSIDDCTFDQLKGNGIIHPWVNLWRMRRCPGEPENECRIVQVWDEVRSQ